jgi:hypothetical protein
LPFLAVGAYSPTRYVGRCPSHPCMVRLCCCITTATVMAWPACPFVPQGPTGLWSVMCRLCRFFRDGLESHLHPPDSRWVVRRSSSRSVARPPLYCVFKLIRTVGGDKILDRNNIYFFKYVGHSCSFTSHSHFDVLVGCSLLGGLPDDFDVPKHPHGKSVDTPFTSSSSFRNRILNSYLFQPPAPIKSSTMSWTCAAMDSPLSRSVCRFQQSSWGFSIVAWHSSPLPYTRSVRLVVLHRPLFLLFSNP